MTVPTPLRQPPSVGADSTTADATSPPGSSGRSCSPHPAPDVNSQHFTLDDLLDLVELHELGRKVDWPLGLDLGTARALLKQPVAAGGTTVVFSSPPVAAATAVCEPDTCSAGVTSACYARHDLDALLTLVELADLGEKVLWPSGLGLFEAKALLARNSSAPPHA